MLKSKWIAICSIILGVPALLASGCGADNGEPARVRLENDFDNPDFERQPPWIICEASYQGATWQDVGLGQTSAEAEAEPGLDYVLMVAAWDDPDCNPQNCLPLASANEEETVAGQQRTIVLNVPNHQGPCPPEHLGIEGMPQQLYDRVLERWPEYGFLPYDQRRENPQCQ